MGRILKILSLLIIISCASSEAINTWTITIPTGASGSFTASEATIPASIGGSFFRLANGFIRLTVTSSSGTGAPTIGTVRYAIEAPGFALFSEPFLTSEGTMLSTAIAGTCPQETWNGLFSYFIWRGGVGTNYDVSDPVTPGFGTFSWNPATNNSTVGDVRNLTSYATLSGYTPFVNAGSCANGTIALAGNGDRGGNLFVSTNGGGVYTTQTARGLFMLPQYTIESADLLNGTYTVFGMDSSWPQNIYPIRMVFSGGTGATGDELTDIAGFTTDSSKTWTLSGITINSPINGMFSASLSLEGGAARNAACFVYFNATASIFCSAQSPIDESIPLNFIMVSDTQTYTSGTTDTYSFGSSTGIVTTTMGAGVDTGRAIALQTDNKIVVAGDNAASWAISRYHPSGNLDTSFDSDGRFTMTIGSVNVATGVQIDTNGKIVVGGYATTGGKVYFGLSRLTTAGAIDTTFGTAGRTTTSHTTQADRAYALNIDANNKILLAGACRTTTDFCISRYTTAGVLDTTFNTTGKRVDTMGTGADDGRALAIQSDGKIVVAGNAVSGNTRFAAIRYTTAGAIDTTFGTAGRVLTSVGTGTGSAGSIAVQPDGKIILAGYGTNTNQDLVLARYSTAGVLDTTFGIFGIKTVDIATTAQQINSVALQADGKIVVGGFTNPSTQDIMVARFTTNGTVDTTFNTTGMYINTVGGTADMAYAVAIQSDRKIVAAGILGNDFYVGRFWSGLEIAADDTYSPLFSAISVIPKAAYSLRKLSWDYSGNAIQVRRASDNTLLDIGFNTYQNLDTSTLLTFCAATSCYVKRWYDQSGNGFSAEQLTDANQPRIVNAGVLDTANGVPTLVLSGAQNLNTTITVDQLVTGGTDVTVTFVVRQTSQTNSSIISNTTGTDRINVHASWSDGNTYFDVGQCCANSRINVAQNWTTALATGTYRREGAQMDLWRDGVLGASRSNASGQTTATNIIYIGSQGPAAAYFTGVFSEVLLFSSGLSTADRIALETDERIYYGTP